MKKKSFNKRLTFNKETVSNLNMSKVQGGIVSTGGTATCVTEGCPTNDCSNPCIIKTRQTEEIC